ncbi:MAG: hypothetical protein WBA46_19185, partial [Thermomicrobiales bacterium]
MSSSDPNRPRSSQDPNGPASGAPEGEDVDFGAFVSSRVRASADKLKGGSRTTTTPPPSSTRSTGTRGAGREASAPSREAQAEPTGDRPRSSRRWRDSAESAEGTAPATPVRGAGTRTRTTAALPPEDDAQPDDAGSGGFGGSVAAAQAWVRDNGEGRPWFLPALIGGALIILLLLIWLLTQLGGGGGGGGDVTPTATSESVIGVPGTTTTVVPTTEGGAPTPTQPVAAPTAPVKTGGDNQRGGDSGTPAAQGAIWENCATSCLVRVNLPGDSPVLATLGARPSFAAGNWSWVVAPPGTVSNLAAKADNVTLIQPDAETLRLYAVRLPDDVKSDDRVQEVGTILDS